MTTSGGLGDYFPGTHDPHSPGREARSDPYAPAPGCEVPVPPGTPPPIDIPPSVPSRTFDEGFEILRPRPWYRALWSRAWAFLVVVPFFYVAMAVLGFALFYLATWEPVNSSILYMLDLVSPADLGYEEASLPTWLAAPIAVSVVTAVYAIAYSAVISPIVTVAVDATDDKDEWPHVLLWKSFQTFVALSIVMFFVMLLLMGMAVLFTLGLAGAVAGLASADTPSWPAIAVAVTTALMLVLLYVAVWLKALFISVNVARRGAVLEGAWKRRPGWVIGLGFAFVAYSAFPAAWQLVLYGVGVPETSTISVGVAVGFVVYQFLGLAAFATVAADLFNREPIEREVTKAIVRPSPVMTGSDGDPSYGRARGPGRRATASARPDAARHP